MALRSARTALALLAGLALLGVLAPAALADDRLEPSAFREWDLGDGRVTFDVVEAPFGDVVAQRIQPKTRVNLLVAPEAAGEKVTLKVVDLHWVHALQALAERIGATMVRKSSNLIRIERPMPVVMSFTDQDIAQVIDQIAAAGNASVTVSPLVKGTVTVKFNNTPWRAALKYVVETAGKYALIEEDYGVLRVVPVSDLEKVSGTWMFRYLRPPPPYKGVIKTGASGGSSGASTGTGSSGGSAQVGADVVQSDVYVPSDDPKKAADQFPIIAALKSIVAERGGDVNYIPDANAIIYTGTAPDVARVRSLCEQLDVEPPQVFIDMNFIATTNQEALDLSLHTDTGGAVNYTGAAITHRLPFAAGGGGWADVISGTNFPSPSSAAFSYGTLDFGRTQMLFQFLSKDKCTKVVQAPKILALDNQAATIFVGESIRYARSTAASNQNGGLTFSVEEDENSPVNVGFQLLVIPHVIPGEGKIMLLVIPQQRALSGTTSPIPGFDRFTVSGQTIDLPRVSSSTLVTSMILRDGETAVIGGLMEDRDQRGEDKIPILGDIPILNLLFRGTSKSIVRQNLLITITPRILRGSDAANSTVAAELSGRTERLASEWSTIGEPCAPAPSAPAAGATAPAPVPVAPTR